MRFQNEFLEEIRSRLPVSAVVGRRVRLKKAGREMKGLSPFTKEKSPSFFVNDQKQFYHCFSSGKHGDIFTFVMETDGLTFPEAVERLAGEAGLSMPRTDPRAEAAERRRAGLHEVMAAVADFYARALLSEGGQRALAYLDGRKVPRASLEGFSLGYAPRGGHALRDHLAGMGVEADVMADLGLVMAGEEGREPFDRFRDRVMIPIADARGRTVGFGGRALDPRAPAKYLNSPETPLFKKGHLLYNLHRAKAPAQAEGTIVCVEGYLDVVAVDAVGMRHAVAPMGTALSAEQMGLLWSAAREPVLCFDGDAAGQRAALRAAQAALPLVGEGRTLRFALLPAGLDPDDIARSSGAEGFARALAGARPLFDVIWAGAALGGALGTPEGRAGLERRLRDTLSETADPVLRKHYLAEAMARLSGLGGLAPAQRTSPRIAGARALGTSVAPLPPGEATLLGALAAHPALARSLSESPGGLPLPRPSAARLREALRPGQGRSEARERLIESVRAEVPEAHRWMLSPGAVTEEVGKALAGLPGVAASDPALALREAERAMAGDASEENLRRLREAHLRVEEAESRPAGPAGP